MVTNPPKPVALFCLKTAVFAVRNSQFSETPHEQETETRNTHGWTKGGVAVGVFGRPMIFVVVSGKSALSRRPHISITR